jgi:hypothetical protein
MLRVGRIQIAEHASFFQMERQDAIRILPALNRMSVANREVRVVMEESLDQRGNSNRPERRRSR